MSRLTFLPKFSVCFCLGIYLAKFIHISLSCLYISAWILLIFSFMYGKRRNSVWPLFILAIFLGGLFLSNADILPYPHIRNFTFYKSEAVSICGVVEDSLQNNSNPTSFILNAERLIWADKIYPVCGRIMVRIFRAENINYADRLILKGRLFIPYQAKNSRFSYRDYLQNQGIYSILTVRKCQSIKYLGKHRANPLKLIAYKIRDRAKAILYKNLKPTPAAIFSAMILGQRSKVPPEINRLFIQTGTAHILAVSGLHVAIIAFMFELLLKAIRLKRRARYLIIALLLILYCILTGARPSVVRATIMAIVVLTGFLLNKDIPISHSLSLAALIILIANPRQLFNIGFQLSFASVISIAYLSPIIKNLCSHKNMPLPLFASTFSVSLAAWLAVLPFVVYYFKIISPVTVIANMIVVPCLVLVIALGFSLLAVGITLPGLAVVFAPPANVSILILIQIIRLFNQVPGAYFYL